MYRVSIEQQWLVLGSICTVMCEALIDVIGSVTGEALKPLYIEKVEILSGNNDPSLTHILKDFER